MIFRQVRENKRKGKKSVLLVTIPNDGEFQSGDWVILKKSAEIIEM